MIEKKRERVPFGSGKFVFIHFVPANLKEQTNYNDWGTNYWKVLRRSVMNSNVYEIKRDREKKFLKWIKLNEMNVLWN